MQHPRPPFPAQLCPYCAHVVRGLVLERKSRRNACATAVQALTGEATVMPSPPHLNDLVACVRAHAMLADTVGLCTAGDAEEGALRGKIADQGHRVSGPNAPIPH